MHTCLSIKTLISWYPRLEDFEVPNKIQSGNLPLSRSTDGGTDGLGYERAPASSTSTGIATIASGTSTRGGAMTTGGMPAIGCSLPQSIKVLLRYHAGGVFDSKPFFQPPTIRPTSSTFSEMRMYFLLSKACNSQETRRKNLRRSIFLTTWIIVGSFSFFP